MTIRYVKLRSWHAVKVLDEFGAIRTRCGREADGQQGVAESLPLEEPSCETCARLVLHDLDKAAEL